MSRMAVCLCLLAVGSLFLLPSSARGEDRVEMSMPFFREPTHQIDSVDREAKTAIVKARPQTPFF